MHMAFQSDRLAAAGRPCYSNLSDQFDARILKSDHTEHPSICEVDFAQGNSS